MTQRLSRIDLLKALTVLPLGVAAVASVASRAEAKGTQAAFKYQNKPKGALKCSGCSLYIANAKNPKANGGCKVVEGSISPNGWCIAYAPKK